VTAAAAERELRALAREACAQLRLGEDGPLGVYAERRDAVLRRLDEPGDVAIEQRAALIRMILDVDREVVAALEAETASLRRQVSRAAEGRRSLGGYRAAPARGALFVDRLG
jgi:hypothetical protein